MLGFVNRRCRPSLRRALSKNWSTRSLFGNIEIEDVEVKLKLFHWSICFLNSAQMFGRSLLNR